MHTLYDTLLAVSSDIGCAGLHLPAVEDVPLVLQPQVEEIAHLMAELQRRLYQAQKVVLKVAGQTAT